MSFLSYIVCEFLLIVVVIYLFEIVILGVLYYLFFMDYSIIYNYEVNDKLFNIRMVGENLEIIPNYKLLELDKEIYLSEFMIWLEKSKDLLYVGTVDQIIFRYILLKGYYLSVIGSYGEFLSEYPLYCTIVYEDILKIYKDISYFILLDKNNEDLLYDNYINSVILNIYIKKVLFSSNIVYDINIIKDDFIYQGISYKALNNLNYLEKLYVFNEQLVLLKKIGLVKDMSIDNSYNGISYDILSDNSNICSLSYKNIINEYILKYIDYKYWYLYFMYTIK